MPLLWASLRSVGEVQDEPLPGGGDAPDQSPATPGADQPQSLGLHLLPLLSGIGALSSMKLFYK